MKKKMLGVLVVINVGLAMLWLGRNQNPAVAAPRAAEAGTYLAIPGEIVGGKSGEVVYVLDSRHDKLTVMAYSKNATGGGGRIGTLDPIDLNRVFADK